MDQNKNSIIEKENFSSCRWTPNFKETNLPDDPILGLRRHSDIFICFRCFFFCCFFCCFFICYNNHIVVCCNILIVWQLNDSVLLALLYPQNCQMSCYKSEIEKHCICTGSNINSSTSLPICSYSNRKQGNFSSGIVITYMLFLRFCCFPLSGGGDGRGRASG